MNGKPAGLFLWTFFGTTHQILVGLTLLTVTGYLYRKRKPILYTLLPMLLVLVATISDIVMGMMKAIAKEQWVVAAVGSLALWVLFEAVVVVMHIRRGRQQESIIQEEPDR